MKVIVGSTALRKLRLHRSEPKDIDLWYSENEEPSDNKGCDSYLIPYEVLRSVELLRTEDDQLVVNSDGCYFATADSIYTIKCSHAVYDIHWEKTKLDILWLKSKGCKLIPDLYIVLRDYWEEVHGNKDFLSLNKNKTEFFTDFVNYEYDHDYLHELVAFPNKPMYTKCLKLNESVLIDYYKFRLMSFEDQVRMFREEITVIACERWVLNSKTKKDISWFKAYFYALRKTVTTLTKGWASEFIILNLGSFVKPEYSYFKHILTTLKRENDMSSKVDLSVFKEISAITNEEVEYVIYTLAKGDFNELRLVSWPQETYEVYKAMCKEKQVEYGYKHLNQEGGGEGGGEYCYGVFELKGKTYKAEYLYYSHHGHDYDDIISTLTEVKPVQKMVTVYE